MKKLQKILADVLSVSFTRHQKKTVLV